MGCLCSKEAADEDIVRPKKEAPTKQFQKPRWKSQEQLTATKLQKMREEFWDTQPHYGGNKVIWDAIKAACEATDMDATRLIIETAGIIVARNDMTVMYDERGGKYDLPKYVITDPTNLIQMPSEQQQQQQQQGQQQGQQQVQQDGQQQQQVEQDAATRL